MCFSEAALKGDAVPCLRHSKAQHHPLGLLRCKCYAFTRISLFSCIDTVLANFVLAFPLPLASHCLVGQDSIAPSCASEAALKGDAVPKACQRSSCFPASLEAAASLAGHSKACFAGTNMCFATSPFRAASLLPCFAGSREAGHIEGRLAYVRPAMLSHAHRARDSKALLSQRVCPSLCLRTNMCPASLEAAL